MRLTLPTAAGRRSLLRLPVSIALLFGSDSRLISSLDLKLVVFERKLKTKQKNIDKLAVLCLKLEKKRKYFRFFLFGVSAKPCSVSETMIG